MTDNDAYREVQAVFLAEGGGIVIPEGFSVELTCSACPEQWDIFFDGRQVGYLRCRRSRWQLHYPDLDFDHKTRQWIGEVVFDEEWHPEISPYESNFDDERPAIFKRVFDALIERIIRDANRR